MIPHWKQKFVLLWTGQALSILSSTAGFLQVSAIRYAGALR